ncbi:hypothetical protein Emag_006644 [Eimeria magna]
MLIAAAAAAKGATRPMNNAATTAAAASAEAALPGMHEGYRMHLCGRSSRDEGWVHHGMRRPHGSSKGSTLPHRVYDEPAAAALAAAPLQPMPLSSSSDKLRRQLATTEAALRHRSFHLPQTPLLLQRQYTQVSMAKQQLLLPSAGPCGARPA